MRICFDWYCCRLLFTFQVRRLIKNGDLDPGLLFLATNEYFIAQVEAALEDYMKERAQACAEAMQDLIFEQTHSIHFEMLEDFFEGCQQFEEKFLSKPHCLT